MQLGDKVLFDSIYVRYKEYADFDNLSDKQLEEFEENGYVSVARYKRSEIMMMSGIIISKRKLRVLNKIIEHDDGWKEVVPACRRDIYLVATTLYRKYLVDADWITPDVIPCTKK